MHKKSDRMHYKKNRENKNRKTIDVRYKHLHLQLNRD